MSHISNKTAKKVKFNLKNDNWWTTLFVNLKQPTKKGLFRIYTRTTTELYINNAKA